MDGTDEIRTRDRDGNKLSISLSMTTNFIKNLQKKPQHIIHIADISNTSTLKQNKPRRERKQESEHTRNH